MRGAGHANSFALHHHVTSREIDVVGSELAQISHILGCGLDILRERRRQVPVFEGTSSIEISIIEGGYMKVHILVQGLQPNLIVAVGLGLVVVRSAEE